MKTLSRNAMVVVLVVCALAPVYGQEKKTETEVREKVTTIKETTTIIKERETGPGERTVAIFIKNRTGEGADDKAPVLEDLLTAAVTDDGFAVISAEDNIKSVASFLGKGVDEDVSGSELDRLLENNTSSVRLAENLGADYLLSASITTAGTDTQRVNLSGVKRTVYTHRLRVTYKILDGASGKSLSAGTVKAEKKTQASEGFDDTDSDVFNDLLADAAEQVADKLREKGGAPALAVAGEKPAETGLTVSASVQDLTVPEVVVDASGAYRLVNTSFRLEAMDVTVELDGVVVGTAPGTFDARPGLHKIKLSREGFRDWNRTINVRPGMNLRVAMTYSDEGRDNWERMGAFLAGLKQDEKLTDAQVDAIKGYAQFLRQSGVRIDRRVDIKVDTKEAPTIEQNIIDKQQNAGRSVW